jgi:hypothetical protein
MEEDIQTGAFGKDLEIQSLHSSTTEIIEEEIQQRNGRKGGVLEEDIEAVKDEECCTKENAATRTSTKNSWKDPGPPPDGGREAWIQGM